MCGQFCLTSLTHWLIPGSSFLPNEDKWVLKSPSFKTFFLAATKMRVAPSRTAAWLSLSARTYLLKCHSQFGKDHFNRKRFIFTREVVTSNLTWAAFFTCQFKQGILILYYTPVNVVIQKMLTWRRVVMFQRSTWSQGYLFLRPRLPDLWHVLWFSRHKPRSTELFSSSQVIWFSLNFTSAPNWKNWGVCLKMTTSLIFT